MKDTKIFITIIIIVIIIFGSVTQCPLEYDASLTRGSALDRHNWAPDLGVGLSARWSIMLL